MEISTSAFSSGLSAIQTVQRRVDQAAAGIAGTTLPQAQQAAPTPGSERSIQADLAENLIALNLGKLEAQAGARVVETADEVLGTLIDTRA